MLFVMVVVHDCPDTTDKSPISLSKKELCVRMTVEGIFLPVEEFPTIHQQWGDPLRTIAIDHPWKTDETVHVAFAINRSNDDLTHRPPSAQGNELGRKKTSRSGTHPAAASMIVGSMATTTFTLLDYAEGFADFTKH